MRSSEIAGGVPNEIKGNPKKRTKCPSKESTSAMKIIRSDCLRIVGLKLACTRERFRSSLQEVGYFLEG